MTEARFVVVVRLNEVSGEECIVGPFQDAHWAKRWVERFGDKYCYCKIEQMATPKVVGKDFRTIFNPHLEIDIPDVDKRVQQDKRILERVRYVPTKTKPK